MRIPLSAKSSFSFVLALLLTIAGCGYYNPYAANSDAKAITISHTLWQNNTNELGLQSVLYQSLSGWLRRSKLLDIKEEVDSARYQITGKIASIDFPEVSYGANNVATELRARLNVDYSIIDRDNNITVLKKQRTYSETFYQNTSPTLAQTNKKEALAMIAEEISEDIYLFLINMITRQ